jgi:hypothetical protein
MEAVGDRVPVGAVNFMDSVLQLAALFAPATV